MLAQQVRQISSVVKVKHASRKRSASLQSSLLAFQHALHKHLCDEHALVVMSSAMHPLAGNAWMQAVQGAIAVCILNCSQGQVIQHLPGPARNSQAN